MRAAVIVLASLAAWEIYASHFSTFLAQDLASSISVYFVYGYFLYIYVYQHMPLGLGISCIGHKSHPSTPRHTPVARSLASTSLARNEPSPPSQVMSLILA